ncbi:MAG: 4-hydroxy-3-methylbut-2-en-1-yl diphosphate synthase [Elusimicrobia bacterium CG06_land_8_20_14_3_00_38_11]|nr:MAG: 4-hydroxy-3-methylbut-2-en-1-yl diphosphate synthase [Elusimicrobia bacterium CG06_land_8_20_14_3_00_38_11]
MYKTKKIKIGNIFIGGGEPVRVQSMTKTKTIDWRSTVNQIKKLEEIGCEIIRVAVPDMPSAKVLSKIKKNIKIPLVADIHFDWRLAVESINQGVDKIRINPGNIGSRENIEKVVIAAKKRKTPIRIGVNAGSLKILKKSEGMLKMSSLQMAEQMASEIMENIKIIERMNFSDIVVSLKSNDVQTTVLANQLVSQMRNYPVHLGITEAGTEFPGIVKSASAFGILLNQKIGDTIRVSLSAAPEEEVRAGWEILKALGLRKRGVEIISCPTCGRCEIDLIKIVHQLEKKLLATRYSLLATPLKVAVMGCIVNGPGEAKGADIGIAGGKGFGLLFKKGKPVKKIPQSKWVDEIIREIKNVQKKI